MSTNFTNKNISSIKINDVKYNIKSAFFHAKENEWKTEELNSYIPKQGEIVIYDIDDVYAYERFKIGDGVQNVIDLPFYNDGFVSYNEQILTDEQRAQARANIAEYQYDWREVAGYSNTTYTLADYMIRLDNSTSVDIEGAMNLTSSVLTQYSALGCLHGCVNYLYNNVVPQGESIVTTWMPRIITDYEAIRNAGLLTEGNLVICAKKDDMYFDIAYAITSYSGDYTHCIYFYDDYEECGYIYYNNNTGAYNVSMPVSRFTDETLSKRFFAADAKAVGEAISEVSALVGDTSVSEQIDTAITNSVADWNQNDETAVDYIKNKPDIATDDEIISMLTEEDMLPVVADSDGAILADESDNILLW